MKKIDKILIGIILVIGLLGFVYQKWIQNDAADKVVMIRYEGKVVASFELTDETEESYTFEENGNTNIVKIHAGKVSIVESNCKDQICVKTGEISRVGETIVCLPHQFSIEIYSNGTNPDSNTNSTSELDDIAN